MKFILNEVKNKKIYSPASIDKSMETAFIQEDKKLFRKSIKELAKK